MITPTDSAHCGNSSVGDRKRLAALICHSLASARTRSAPMSSEREGEHPARAYGSTGGGFAEGQADPEQSEEDEKDETGRKFRDRRGRSREGFPENEQLGSCRQGSAGENGQPGGMREEGTFGRGRTTRRENKLPECADWAESSPVRLVRPAYARDSRSGQSLSLRRSRPQTPACFGKGSLTQLTFGHRVRHVDIWSPTSLGSSKRPGANETHLSRAVLAEHGDLTVRATKDAL